MLAGPGHLGGGHVLQLPLKPDRNVVSVLKDRPVFIVFGLIALLLFLVPNYGQSWDVHYNELNAQKAYTYYFEGFDKYAFRTGFVDLYYGPIPDLIILLLQKTTQDRYQQFLIRTFVQALVSWSSLIPLFLIASRLMSQGRALICVAAVVLTPAFFGHAFMNPKDSVLTSGFIWALYLIMLLPSASGRASLGLLAGLGALLGLVCTVRYLAAYLLLLVPVALILLPCLRPRDSGAEPGRAGLTRCLLAGVGRNWPGLAVLALAFLVVYTLCMPGILSKLSPATYINVLKTFARFAWNGSIRYFGADVGSTNLPWHYVYGYMAVQLPLYYHLFLLSFLSAALFFPRRLGRAISRLYAEDFDRFSVLLLLSIALAFPFLLIFVTRPVLYDAFRHVLFVVPILCVVLYAAFLWSLEMWRQHARAALVGLAVVFGLQSCLQIARLHPYEYTYYNPLVSPVGAFELDYWSTSFREVAEWLNEYARTNTRSGEKVRVSVCGTILTFGPFLEWDRFHFTDESPTLAVALNRWDCLSKLKGPRLYTVHRGNRVFAAVARP